MLPQESTNPGRWDAHLWRFQRKSPDRFSLNILNFILQFLTCWLVNFKCLKPPRNPQKFPKPSIHLHQNPRKKSIIKFKQKPTEMHPKSSHKSKSIENHIENHQENFGILSKKSPNSMKSIKNPYKIIKKSSKIPINHH